MEPIGFNWNEWANPKKKHWHGGLINQGEPRLFFWWGTSGLMGGTLWELSKLMIFIKNFIRNRSFGGYMFFFSNFQWSAVMGSIRFHWVLNLTFQHWWLIICSYFGSLEDLIAKISLVWDWWNMMRDKKIGNKEFWIKKMDFSTGGWLIIPGQTVY